MRKTFISLFIIISVLLNIFFIYINIYPLLKSKPIYIYDVITEKEYEELVLNGALKMLDHNDIVMPTRQQSNFKEEVLNLIGRGRKHSYFFYPRAYLYAGITSYASSKNKYDIIENYRDRIDMFINEDGSPAFDLKVVDQVPFGLTALNMYKLTGEMKYKIFADSMIVFLKSKDTDCGILYREDDGNRNQHNDVLGLICPFLSQYSQMFNDTSVYNLNVRQIQKYQIYGLDDNTGLPIHGFNRDFGYQVGAANWGRGIGWYALGLATIEDENLKRELKTDLFCNSIVKTELPEGGYAQYPGSSFTFDSSSTVMLRLALQQMQKTDNKDLIKIMAPYTTKDGWIDQTSGDTYGFNMYSYSFGFSELTQGLMLILLSNTDI